MQGWLKLHRDLFEKAIWTESTPEQKTILITLLGMANHKEKQWEWKGEKYNAKPGQFVTSLPKIAEKCGKGVTVQNVRTALNKFEKYGFLTGKSTNKNRLITLENWGFYQGSDEESNSLTNRQSTGNQQATNRQLTSNKNVRTKERKNERITSSSSEQNAFQFYEQNFPGGISPFLTDQINNWIEDIGEGMVVEAMKIAAKGGKDFRYADGVMKRFVQEGIETPEQLEAQIEQREREQNGTHRQGNRGNYGKGQEAGFHSESPGERAAGGKGVEQARKRKREFLDDLSGM